MPKINDKVFCINHPHKEMEELASVLFIYAEKGNDGKYYQGTKVLVSTPFICYICGYFELYNLTDAQGVLAEQHDYIQVKADDQSFLG